MPLSTPIDELIDDDEINETIEIPKSKSCKKASSYFNYSTLSISQFSDAFLIAISAMIVLNVSLENYSYAAKPMEYIGEIPLQSVLIAMVFVLLKLLYTNSLSS